MSSLDTKHSFELNKCGFWDYDFLWSNMLYESSSVHRRIPKPSGESNVEWMLCLIDAFEFSACHHLAAHFWQCWHWRQFVTCLADQWEATRGCHWPMSRAPEHKIRLRAALLSLTLIRGNHQQTLSQREATDAFYTTLWPEKVQWLKRSVRNCENKERGWATGRWETMTWTVCTGGRRARSTSSSSPTSWCF